jgi:hypothetical protein
MRIVGRRRLGAVTIVALLLPLPAVAADSATRAEAAADRAEAAATRAEAAATRTEQAIERLERVLNEFEESQRPRASKRKSR